jgi:hypothetical protein
LEATKSFRGLKPYKHRRGLTAALAIHQSK